MLKKGFQLSRTMKVSFNTCLHRDTQRWKAVSDVIEQFTVQKTDIKSKRNFNPVCRTLLKTKPFWGIELLVSFLSAFNLYVISAAMKLNTIACHHKFRNHLIEIITQIHLIVPTLFLVLCSTFPWFSGSYSWTLHSGWGRLRQNVSIQCTSQVVVSFWELTQIWWLLPCLEFSWSHFYMCVKTFLHHILYWSAIPHCSHIILQTLDVVSLFSLLTLSNPFCPAAGLHCLALCPMSYHHLSVLLHMTLSPHFQRPLLS